MFAIARDEAALPKVLFICGSKPCETEELLLAISFIPDGAE